MKLIKKRNIEKDLMNKKILKSKDIEKMKNQLKNIEENLNMQVSTKTKGKINTCKKEKIFMHQTQNA